MNEVCPARYSPAELPCRMRAAPAKNLISSTSGGSSSAIVRDTGLPVLRHSAATISSARDSIASASLSSARLRSAGVASRHPPWAAALSAASTSAGPETGACAYTSPVLGDVAGPAGGGGNVLAAHEVGQFLHVDRWVCGSCQRGLLAPGSADPAIISSGPDPDRDSDRPQVIP